MNAIALIQTSKLSELDWRVVEMARQDGPRSLRPEGFWARLSRDLFGLPVPQSLANQALEALRRFCVRAWFWDFVRTSDVSAVAAAGYSWTDVQQVLAHIATHRGFTPSVQEQGI
jgi:hypothetical protein